MGSLTFSSRISLGVERAISASQLLDTYFFGIDVKTPSGKPMSEEVINTYIDAAVSELENYLNVKLTKQIIQESIDFIRNDFENWSFIKTTYPIHSVYSLKGYLQSVQQVEYPKSWLSVAIPPDDRVYARQLNLVPTTDGVGSSTLIFNGAIPHMGYFNHPTIPNYWRVEYCTGWNTVPKDIINVVGKLAAINIFHIMGDLILGAGIASQSLGIDGLSQSISTTSSATNAGYGARVQGYLKDLKDSLPRLKSMYDGFTMISM